MNESEKSALIMLIDDEPENLNLLEIMLRRESWDIRAFTNGAAALAMANRQPPDLVLLDIRMPEMDGYEVCRRFKQDDILNRIPIIFLSGATETSDKVRAFAAGGADYITKPFAEDEVLARTHAHLRLYRHQNRLEQLVRQRMKELAEAHNRLRIWDEAKNDWLNMLSHEMRTPLTGMFCVADLLFMNQPATEENMLLQAAYEESRHRIIKLMDDANLLSQINVDDDGFHTRRININDCLNQALGVFTKTHPETGVTLKTELPGSTTAMVEEVLMQRAFTDLMYTAFCCVEEGEGFQINACCREGNIRIVLYSGNNIISDSDLHSFFDVGGQRTLVKGGGDFGLAPVLARRIIRLFSGNVTVHNDSTNGLTITAEIPEYTG